VTVGLIGAGNSANDVPLPARLNRRYACSRRVADLKVARAKDPPGDRRCGGAQYAAASCSGNALQSSTDARNDDADALIECRGSKSVVEATRVPQSGTLSHAIKAIAFAHGTHIVDGNVEGGWECARGVLCSPATATARRVL